MKKMIAPILLIAWMGLIFYMSSQQGGESSGLSNKIVSKLFSLFPFLGDPDDKEAEIFLTFSLIVRKTAHFTEYLILAVLAFFFISSYYVSMGAYLFSWLFATIYAITDEIHQHFIPGRVAAPLDVCVDSAGALFGVYLVFLVMRARKRSRAGGNTDEL
ncbi:MAG: VanZ family protein [Lachnospiraceae bacterium]|nr:VanZ family protein [Lachnospiraceae bacterium]